MCVLCCCVLCAVCCAKRVVQQTNSIGLDKKRNIGLDKKRNIGLDKKLNIGLDKKPNIGLDKKRNIGLDNKKLNIGLDKKYIPPGLSASRKDRRGGWPALSHAGRCVWATPGARTGHCECGACSTAAIRGRIDTSPSKSLTSAPWLNTFDRQTDRQTDTVKVKIEGLRGKG